MLAYYMPKPYEKENVKEYTAEDLLDPEVVEELFDYCQILEGYITKSGWDYLISNHGYENLFQIDKKSGWIDSDNLEEYISDLEYEKELGFRMKNRNIKSIE